MYLDLQSEYNHLSLHLFFDPSRATDTIAFRFHEMEQLAHITADRNYTFLEFFKAAMVLSTSADAVVSKSELRNSIEINFAANLTLLVLGFG